MKKVRNALIVIETLLLVLVVVCCVGAASKKSDSCMAGKADNIKKVALTFDDGPNGDYTEELLAGLATRKVKATFFLIGKKAEMQPQVVKDIWKGGHMIGNHTYDHVNLCNMSESRACEQIEKTNQVIQDITGECPLYPRPPFGRFKKKIDEKMNMIEIRWDVDPRDWSDKNTGDIVNRVVTKVKENDMILLHDTYATSVVAALEIVDILQAEGYDFVTVDELILN
jgi:peptidoglycan/xylan/chitin deacetylase (PgdA/CDA1 family)